MSNAFCLMMMTVWKTCPDVSDVVGRSAKYRPRSRPSVHQQERKKKLVLRNDRVVLKFREAFTTCCGTVSHRGESRMLMCL